MIVTVDEIAVECFALENSAAMAEKTLRRVTAALTRSEGLVESFLRQSTAYALRTEVITIQPEQKPTLVPVETLETEYDFFIPRYLPVQASGLVVYENTDANVFGELQIVATSDYQLENVVDGWSASGVIRKLSGGWATAPGGMKVVYYSGASTTQNARNWELIKLAVVSTFRSEYAKNLAFEGHADSGAATPITSESIGKESRSYDVASQGDAIHGRSTSIPAEAIEILQPLINYGAFL